MLRQPVRALHEISSDVAQRISWLRRRLLCWFARNGRSFPWREATRTPYEVVVAEILLQRTTAVAVARTYIGFLKRYPSWIVLAQAPLEGLENLLRPLGLWRQKAQAFQRLAQSIEMNSGVVPDARKELERLPGIGPYTASRAAPRCQYDPPPGSVSRTTREHRGETQTRAARTRSSSGKE